MGRDWRDVYQEQIEECRNSDKMNSWEADFLDSIEWSINDSETLTPKQIETLERCLEKARK
jgi:hypothetical protein